MAWLKVTQSANVAIPIYNTIATTMVSEIALTGIW